MDGKEGLERAKEVIDEMDNLNRVIDGLESAGDEMLKRLEPVLRERPPTTDDEKEPNRSAPHAEALACSRRRVNLVAGELKEILKRLEI